MPILLRLSGFAQADEAITGATVGDVNWTNIGCDAAVKQTLPVGCCSEDGAREWLGALYCQLAI